MLIIQAFHPLLSLPFELRCLVYANYFATVTLTFPKLDNPLLSANRQIRTEAKEFYYKHATFSFLRIADFLAFMKALNRQEWQKLRHIRCKTEEFPSIRALGKHWSCRLHFASYVRLFPGLALETLVLEDPLHKPSLSRSPPARIDVRSDRHEDRWTYQEVQDMVKSQGFKKLTYISRSDDFLTWLGRDCDRGSLGEFRPGQPSHWDKMIKEADGEGSGAYVKIGIKNERVFLDEVGQRMLRSYETASPSAREPEYGRVEAAGPVRVYVQRGHGVIYAQGETSVHETDDELREYFHDNTWEWIKSQEVFVIDDSEI